VEIKLKVIWFDEVEDLLEVEFSCTKLYEFTLSPVAHIGNQETHRDSTGPMCPGRAISRNGSPLDNQQDGVFFLLEECIYGRQAERSFKKPPKNARSEPFLLRPVFSGGEPFLD
jgi:hypothetical protein